MIYYISDLNFGHRNVIGMGHREADDRMLPRLELVIDRLIQVINVAEHEADI